MLYLIGIIISAFLFTLLLFKRGKSGADNILTNWLGVILVHQSVHYISNTDMVHQYPHVLGLSFFIPVLHGVLLFFYVSALISENPVKRKWLHFVPTILLILLAIPFYSLSGAEKIAVFEQGGKGFEWYTGIQLTLIIASGATYIVWSLVALYRYRKSLKSIFSNTEKKNLRWLELLTYGLGLIWLLVLFFDDQVIFLGVTVFVLFIGFYGINQVPVFSAAQNSVTPPEHSDKAVPNHNRAFKRYAKSGLKEEEKNLVYQLLKAKMETEGWFKESDLTLYELANRLEIHPNYLSQIINEKEEKNFYNYINSLRVSEFIRQASKPQNSQYTFLALAYDCGFKSKSTFNKYFKKYTDQTPSAYFKDNKLIKSDL